MSSKVAAGAKTRGVLDSGASAFQADPAAVYAFVDRFFRGLVDVGVEHVCVSPGSRSTPLCVTAEMTPGLRTWVGLDERATSFFALGLAKATGRPVVLVCTSGTAAANYLPAVVEAHYARVPLILLTADRPPELRDWGAGQTIDQVGLYGNYCRFAAEAPLVSVGEDAERYAAQLAGRLVSEAQGMPVGPVHLNWPFREPLPPPAEFFSARQGTRDAEERPTPQVSRARREANAVDIQALVELAKRNERGVILCGPLAPDDARANALAGFARAAGWPVLADPTSGLRGHPAFASESDRLLPLVCGADGFLRSEAFASRMRPDVVLRLGETPVSKVQRLWIETSSPPEVWWLDEGNHWGEPSRLATRVVDGGVTSLLSSVSEELSEMDRREGQWWRSFESAERAARAAVAYLGGDEANFSSVSVAAQMTKPRAEVASGVLFASNSMSVRLVDLVLAQTPGLSVQANRGASGIDGINSTALGFAASEQAPTELLTGDLALLHDLPGLLLAKREALDLLIVVIDDGGGGIFSFLPIAEQGEAVAFERLFGTPHGVELERVAALFDLHYERATSIASFDEALAKGRRRKGVGLVHVPLDRERNTALYRELLRKIASVVDAGVPS